MPEEFEIDANELLNHPTLKEKIASA